MDQLLPAGQQHPSAEERSLRTRVFVILLSINLINNFDTGVIPASLLNIQQQLGLTYKQTGLIGSIDYFGVSLGSISLPFILHKIGVKSLMIWFLLLNSGMSALIANSSMIYVIYFARFVQGFTQSFITSYTPIWINEFAPQKSMTLWMGLFGSFSSLGIMLGYSAGALAVDLLNVWRPCFYVQAGVQLIIVLATLATQSRLIDVWQQGRSINGNNQQQINSAQGFAIVVKEPVFLATTLIMCCLYFVVTAVQYWATSYAIQQFSIQQFEANIIFSVCAITGPILGVLFGGRVIDESGGYRGEFQRLQAIKFVSMFCMAASAFAFGFNASLNLPFTVVNLWLLLFFGGTMVPICNGIIVSTFTKELQPHASAILQVSLAILGYFLSPLVTGAVMDMYSDKVEGLAEGLKFGVGIAGLGLASSLLNVYYGHRQLVKGQLDSSSKGKAQQCK